MAKFCLAVFCSCISLFCLAQQRETDSVLNELKKHRQDDTLRLALLNLITYYYSKTNTDKGLEAGNMAITLANKLNSQANLALAYNNKGLNYGAKNNNSLAMDLFTKALNIYGQLNKKTEAAKVFQNIGLLYQKSNYYKALEYYQKALAIFEQLHDEENTAHAFKNMGVAYQFLSNYPKALQYQQKALNIFEQLSNKTGMANALANMGIVYMYLENFSKALEYHQKSFKIYEQSGYQKGMADELGNIGNVYDNMDDSAKALQSYQRALSLSNIAGDKSGIASNLSNIGIVYNYYSNYSKALEYMLKALDVFEKSGDKSNTSLMLNEIARIYCNGPDWVLKQQGVQPKDRYSKAIQYHKRALLLAQETGSLMRQAFSWESLGNTYEKQNDFANALQAFKQTVVLKDSSLNDKKKQEITRLEMQYEFDKKETAAKAENDKKHALANAAIKQEQTVKNFVMAGGIILLMASIIIFIFYKRRRDAEEKKHEAEFKVQAADTEMKALRSQMNPHFIFNSLNSINDYIDKHDTAKATLYTTKFAKLMRMILENSEQKEIPLADDLKALELYIQLESLRLHDKFSYEIRVDDDIDKDNTLIPPLILQPFVENSIWHGFANKEGKGKILIHIKKDGQMMNCIVDDNGAGMTEMINGNAGKKSLGMKLTGARIDILNKLKKANAGVQLFNKEEGVRAEVRIPLELSF